MQKNIHYILLSLFIFGQTIVYGQTPGRTHDARILETSPQIVQLLRQQTPVAVDFITDRLIQVESLDAVTAISQYLHEATGRCGGFVDVTDEQPHLQKNSLRSKHVQPSVEAFIAPPQNPDPVIVQEVQRIRSDEFSEEVQKFYQQFPTRNARSQTGLQASQWLQTYWLEIARQRNRNDVTVELIEPPRGFVQSTVVATIPGRTNKIVLLGAHIDSINHTRSGRSLDAPAPGADDDASGIAAITIALKHLLSNHTQLEHTIQIVAYAAEEYGLHGSRQLAERYAETRRDVIATLQLDMIGYQGSRDGIYFMTDYVSRELTRWSERIVEQYIGVPFFEDECGYACSDHASWTRYGFRSIMPFESMSADMNPRIHTPQDEWNGNLNANHGNHFVRFGYVFALLLAK